MNQPSSRIHSVDILRGLVMMLMALDHVRDYFHADAMLHDPLDVTTTTPLLFFTRWITHYCAPVFVFLSGMSAWFAGTRRTKAELSKFLVTRGFVLILFEFTLINFGWTFNPFFPLFVMQVIWAIGISMVILGLLVRLPYAMIVVFAIAVIGLHNLLDPLEAARDGKVGFLWDLIHHGGFNVYEITPGHGLLIIYPFLPWAGLMAAGFCMGKLYDPQIDAVRRKKILLLSGASLIGIFILFRGFNIYGDPSVWNARDGFVSSALTFLHVSKYPPSLLFMCMTIGPALIGLALTEQTDGAASRVIKTYGRVPFFYYVLHIYLIHLLVVALFFSTGHTMADLWTEPSMFLFRPAKMGFSLAGVYLVWAFVLAVLYPLCRWFDRYRAAHSQWWLKYL